MFIRATQVAVAIAIVAACQPAFAEEPSQAPPAPAAPAESTPSSTKPTMHLDAAPVAALPLGDLANVTGPALGAMLGVAYDLDDRWGLVFHGGYLAGATTSYQVADVTVNSSISYTPLLGGVRRYFTEPGAIRLYGAVEAGAIIVNVSSNASGSAASASASGESTYLGGTASMGLQLDILDLRAGVLTADLGHAGTSTSGLLSLGFQFASW
jgi:hypothetical protein